MLRTPCLCAGSGLQDPLCPLQRDYPVLGGKAEGPEGEKGPSLTTYIGEGCGWRNWGGRGRAGRAHWGFSWIQVPTDPPRAASAGTWVL